MRNGRGWRIGRGGVYGDEGNERGWRIGRGGVDGKR